ncbi:class I SAM-dependent methyltransferase [Motilibacter sp. K478]|nr:class I SAM-dependent methyltransferase [Motilibacter aurantiacus]NHC46987.1 class I SAM-dependent methyltransferase [Motilibacter aurantiacus]
MGDGYLRHAEDGPFNAEYDRPAVLSALAPVAGKRVLDAGCGPGLYVSALLAAGAEVVGFDASPAMVDLARTRAGTRARIDRAELGAALPYADQSFDLAVCALAIHYVENRVAAFAELHRVLRPQGALVVSTQHPTADWLRKGGSYFDRVLESDTWALPDGRRQQVRYWRAPLTDLCKAATDSGFVIDLLLEPRPTDRMRVSAPEDYARLQSQPGFLVLRLRRAA